MFYASAANTITGPLVDQADIFPDLANPSFQDHANEAIHRFITYGLAPVLTAGRWATKPHPDPESVPDGATSSPSWWGQMKPS